MVRDGGAVPEPWRGAPAWSGSTSRPWPSRPRRSAASTGPGRARTPSSSRWRSIRRASVPPRSWDDAPWTLGPRLRAVARPAALPRLGQHLRRPRRRTRCGGGPARPPGSGRRGHAGRAGRRRAARRPPGLGRRRARAAPLDRRCDGAGVVHARVRRARPARARARRRARRRADARPRPAGRGRPRRRPARVIAPAGSGKTRVLTERLRHLHRRPGLEREAVLAVAYNKQAQLEMEERTADFRPRVQTLNALGYSPAGRAPGPAAAGARRARGAPHRRATSCPQAPPRANTDPLGPYLEALTAVRLGPARPGRGRGRARRRARASPPPSTPTASGWPPAGAVDFDEQVYGAVELLLRDGDVPAPAPRPGTATCWSTSSRTSRRPTCCCCGCWPRPALDVFGVGDDDQVIYGHAGADPAFLIDFDQLFPGAADHPLEVNYRCPVAVVDAARHLLSYNQRRVDKEIRAGPAADPTPDALRRRSRTAPEAGAAALARARARVAGRARRGRRATSPCSPGSTRCCWRPTWRSPRPASRWTPCSRPDVLERTGVRAALAYLRIGARPGRLRADDLVEVYRRPSRGLPAVVPEVAPAASSTSTACAAIADRSTTRRWRRKVDAPRRRPAPGGRRRAPGRPGRP